MLRAGHPLMIVPRPDMNPPTRTPHTGKVRPPHVNRFEGRKSTFRGFIQRSFDPSAVRWPGRPSLGRQAPRLGGDSGTSESNCLGSGPRVSHHMEQSICGGMDGGVAHAADSAGAELMCAVHATSTQ